MRTFDRRMTSRASLPLKRVLTGTSHAPTLCTASAATTHSLMLGAQIATRSPRSHAACHQRAGRLVDPLRELGERPSGLTLDERLVVGEAPRRVVDELGDRRPRSIRHGLDDNVRTWTCATRRRPKQFRVTLRAFLAEHLPSDWQGIGALDREDAEAFTLRWRRVLFENGLLGIAWPKEYGGGGRTKVEQVVLAEEFARARVPLGRVTDTTSIKMLGNTLLRWGTEEQKRRFVPRILSGEDVWVQGYSEPEAGSDLAGLRLRADRDGSEWVINGQKIWTSRGAEGNWIFLLARTDPDAAKNRGISFLLCPLDIPGVEVRPITTLTGDAEFCEVFFTDARIPLENIVGEVNGGWAVATSLLGHERGEEAATNPILFRAEFDRIVRLARDHGRDRDPVVRDRLAWCYTKVETMRFLGYRILTQYLRDGVLGPEASISKLYWSEYHQHAVDLALAIMGADALVRRGRRPYKHFRTDEPGAENSTNSWIDVFLLNARFRNRLRGDVGGAAQHHRRDDSRPPERTTHLRRRANHGLRAHRDRRARRDGHVRSATGERARRAGVPRDPSRRSGAWARAPTPTSRSSPRPARACSAPVSTCRTRLAARAVSSSTKTPSSTRSIPASFPASASSPSATARCPSSAPSTAPRSARDLRSSRRAT